MVRGWLCRTPDMGQLGSGEAVAVCAEGPRRSKGGCSDNVNDELLHTPKQLVSIGLRVADTGPCRDRPWCVRMLLFMLD